MKKILIMVCMLLMVFTVCTFAANDVKVLLDDGYMDFTDENGDVVNPELTNSRTMVPLRKIFEAIGAEIEWDNDTRTVTAVKENKTIKLTIDKEEAYIIENGVTQTVLLDSPAYIVEGRTLIPLRFVSESFGCLVGWDNDSRTAIIVNPETLTKYGIGKFISKCGNIIEFASKVKVNNNYSITTVDFKMANMGNNVFSDNINFKVINNKDKAYINFITNPFKPEYSEATDEEIINGFFEMDLTQLENNINQETPEQIVGSVVGNINQDDTEVTLTTYIELKEAIDLVINLLSKGKVNENGISWKIDYKDLVTFDESLEDVDGEVNLIILLDDNNYVKTVHFSVNAEVDGERASIFIGAENEYSKTAFKLPVNAQMDTMENLATSLLMILMFYGF